MSKGLVNQKLVLLIVDTEFSAAITYHLRLMNTTFAAWEVICDWKHVPHCRIKQQTCESPDLLCIPPFTINICPPFEFSTTIIFAIFCWQNIGNLKNGTFNEPGANSANGLRLGNFLLLVKI